MQRISAAIAIVTILMTPGCQEKEKKGPQQAAAVPVAMAKVSRQDLAETVPAVGTLEAPEDVQVAAERPGRVTGIHFAQGEPVAAGDLLYTLDDEELRQQLKARQAALAEARAEYQDARRSYQRREELLAQRVIAEETRDEARTAMETARARVVRLEAEIGRQQEELADTRVVAPVAGVTGERRADLGDFVDTGDVLVTIVGNRQVQIAFTVPERYLGKVAIGQAVAVKVAAWPDQSIPGTVFFISPRIDASTRTLLLKARIDKSDDRLRPGGFAAVDLTLDRHPEALVVPEEALVPTRSGYLVFLVEDGRAKKREVTIGLRRPGVVELTSGVKAGDTVIRRGHMEVADGDRVRPVDEEGQ